MKKSVPEISDRTKKLEKTADVATRWIGSTRSLLVHTLVFAAAFIIPFFGIPLDRVLLVLTTALSLEAIYLAIFIQMSVNKNTADIEVIQGDVEEIQEEIEDIGEDVEEIQKDVDDIAEEIEDIGEDVEEIQKDVDEIQEDVEGIEKDVEEIQGDIEGIEEDSDEDVKIEQKEQETLTAIQETLATLQKEIESLKKKK